MVRHSVSGCRNSTCGHGHQRPIVALACGAWMFRPAPQRPAPIMLWTQLEAARGASPLAHGPLDVTGLNPPGDVRVIGKLIRTY